LCMCVCVYVVLVSVVCFKLVFWDMTIIWANQATLTFSTLENVAKITMSII
jgi:hypothetical protein